MHGAVSNQAYVAQGTSRVSRRPTTDNINKLNKTNDIAPTIRSRGARRWEETSEVVESSTSRIRSRSRTLEHVSGKVEPQPQSGQNQQFESRRSNSRTRKPLERELSSERNLDRESVIRGRSRHNGRKYSQVEEPITPSNRITTTVGPRTVENKSEITKLNEIQPTSEARISDQLRRRSSTVSTMEEATSFRPRGRIDTRKNSRPIDLEVAGTTNTFTAAVREPITKNYDARNSRKLRYKTRTYEIDTNLTGEGITVSSEVQKSSQKTETASQTEMNDTILLSTTTTETTLVNHQSSSEKNLAKTSTLKSMKIVRRPVTRSNSYSKSAEANSQSKMSDEISEDDNYPESFKALIQARNATQPNSPSSESLSVKASQRVSKNYVSPTQTFSTNRGTDSNSRLRKKLKTEENSKDLQIAASESSTTVVTTTTSKPTQRGSTSITTPDLPKPRSVTYRPRGSYLPRSSKLTRFPPTTEVTRPSTERQYKFSRKLKNATEPSKTDITLKTKRLENSPPKKQVIRSSLFTRKNDPFNNNITVIPLSDNRKNDRVQSASHFKARRTLPSTSYYSRLKNNTNTSTIETKANTETPIAEKKIESSAGLPLIFTYLNSPSKSDNYRNDNDKNTTTIAYGEESPDNVTENEVLNKVEESESKVVLNTETTTQKYHANYKEDPNFTVNERAATSATPAIRNIQTRKYGRKPGKVKEQGNNSTVIFKTKERNIRKYGDNFSKTTEAPENSIKQEPEKPKHKFSSKYRASYLDKPFYKPTVPTVTPTAAWLKLFVTDEYKVVDDPTLFGNDFFNATTEIISRMNFTSPIYSHESSIELVEGEETLLGPDMNAITITKNRRPLSSADLRLSESLAKPLQVLNVEASQHSPSVTVSIFDALAEILTSTPKPRISTTTEILSKQNNEINIMHTLDGVSSNINVNSVTGFANQETVTSKDNNVNTNAKFVQTTEQIVFNSLPVGENVTKSLKAEDEKTTSFTSPKTFPTTPFTPTTPLSARKPFAIKVLYSETESPDKRTTAATGIYAGSTDRPKMVYNSISDLLLSNNGLVSSGLTSMLSNNIRSIIQNMDEESKSRLSVGMTNLLNSLSPGALNNTQIVDDDSSPAITTPYSLEDIKDTENFDIYVESSNENNILQNVGVETTVNSIEILSNTNSIATTESPIPVNRFSTEEILSESSSINSLSENSFQRDFNILTTTRTTTTSRDIESTTRSSDTISTNVNIEQQNVDNLTPTNKPEPAFTNPPQGPTLDLFYSQLQLPSSSTNLLMIPQEKKDGLPNPNQVSQLQLWILSKKARVLKMIEDLLREHNNDIANPPFKDNIQSINKSNVSLSSRLTEIMTTMDSTTDTPDSDVTEQTTMNTPENPTPIPTSPIAPFTTTSFPETTLSNLESILTQSPYSNSFMNVATTDIPSEMASKIADVFTNDNSFLPTTVSNIEELITNEVSKERVNDTLELISSTTSSESKDEQTQTETISLFSTTAVSNVDETTSSGIETTTAKAVLNDNKTSDCLTTSNILNVATRPSIPKKDFVIFGILPNNTVVRKDPNDNPLEALTEASPYIIYGVLPNNTIIRRFPNGTRVPQIMQKIDVLPISPWSLKNPYSPIHNIPAIVRPQSNPIRVSTNTVISTDTSNNEKENSLTTDTVNNLQIPSSALNINDSSSLGITTTSTQLLAEKSTASHVLSLRTTTMLPSVDEILLNSISLATKEEMVISSMTSSTPEPRILTLDIDPETKQIRTEKPNDGSGNTVFKFIPIEDVTVPSSQETNVLKLASPKTLKPTTFDSLQTTIASTTEVNTQTPQIQTNTEPSVEITSTTQTLAATPFKISTDAQNNESVTPEFNEPIFTTDTKTAMIENAITEKIPSSTEPSTVMPTTDSITTNNDVKFSADLYTTTEVVTDFTLPSTTYRMPTATSIPTASATNSIYQTQTNTPLTQTERNAKNLAGFNNAQVLQNQQEENAKLLQALLLATGQNTNSAKPSNSRSKSQTTTSRSIEDDIRQFEEDTKLLKALLQATGRDPASLNIPSLNDIKSAITTAKPVEPTTTFSTTTTEQPTTQTSTTQTIFTKPTQSVNDEIQRLQEDTKLLQALLQATSNKNIGNMPIISGLTSNVRIASNPLTTSMETKSTTAFNVRPVYTTTRAPSTTTVRSQIITVSTLQPTTEDIGISTTFRPVNVKAPTTTKNRPTVTTEIPSSSTYSDEEDLLFLQNLKSVLSTNQNEDPETALANRVIALAVERSLNEIQVGKSVGTTKVMTTTTPIPTTTTVRTTTTRATTTRATTTPPQNIPSIENDIKQLEQDTKLLQALLKATGQDPSKFNIPTLPTTSVSPQIPQHINDDLELLSNLLASPSPLNEPFDPLTQRPADIQTTPKIPTTTSPNVKIAVKDDLRNEQDDAKLLQTLIKLQDAQETTTIRNKLAITGHSPDEALKKLIQKTQPGMMSESTKPSMSLSTEYGNSNDALLAALLKEQGFGPTTALLNQVVVTPKARRTTTVPPPPAPRRPILDGLAWLWQQWRDTAPGSAGPQPSRPTLPRQQAAQPPSTSTSSRVNWFGSGPFVGNADERPSNRIPLEPPSAVEQPPGRGQLVSAAINVTRAFSQFLGAAIQVLCKHHTLLMKSFFKWEGNMDDKSVLMKEGGKLPATENT
ncbi:unnamed protein product [Leptosia nina]|uniref:Uncharacterized protein n=1 Tax=Leptosia nina TaxID=320188 RepID=A0AAV1JQP1_9NEOP